MQSIDIAATQAQAQEIVQAVMRGEHLDVVITGAMLLSITALSLASIWKNRTPSVKSAPPTSANAVGMMRWLTPGGSKSVTAEQTAIVSRPTRKSGSHKTIRVITPVSKVTAKMIRASADPMEIARRSGLSRDGVAMMMAAAVPKGQSAKQAVANTASKQNAPARTSSNANAASAMLAPGAYTQAQRVIPAKVDRPGVGTRFSARVS